MDFYNFPASWPILTRFRDAQRTCNLSHAEPKEKKLLDEKDGYVLLAEFRTMAQRLVALEEKARVGALKGRLKETDKTSSSLDSDDTDSDDISSTCAYSNGCSHRQSRRRARRRSHHHRRSDSRALKSSRYSHHQHLEKGETIKSFE